MINILINGVNGKMGQTTAAAIADQTDLHLAATTSRNHDLLSEIKKNKIDVVIDWTTPTSVFENAQTIIDAGARLVIGTTGLSSDQIKCLSDKCESKKIGCIIAPNFSIGAILMMKYAQDAAKYFPDVEIIEYHHPQKKDAPSGTAKRTAELIAETKNKKNTSNQVDIQLKDKAARGESYYDVPIHAVRMTGVFANQAVIFGGSGETLTLQHNATDRNAMMPGLFLCCRKVMELNHLVYGLEDFL